MMTMICTPPYDQRNVDDVWNWPRAEGAPWRHWKHEAIHAKLQALGARGKGPVAKKAGGGQAQKGHH